MVAQKMALSRRSLPAGRSDRGPWSSRRLSKVPAWTVLVWIAFPGSAALAREPGAEPEAPSRVSDAELYRPSAMPDRIVLTWIGDGATSRAVTWRTSTAVRRAFAEIAVAGGGPRFREGARRVDAVTQPFRSDLSECHVHSVEFRDLRPGTCYAYRVGDGANFSEWFHFRTAGAPDEPFSFVYFGDAQNDIRSLWSRVIREAALNTPRAAFMVHAGDLVNRADADAMWGEWFAAGGWLTAMIPVVATPGNHDYASEKKPDGSTVRRLSRHWRAQFTFPPNGPTGLEETVYYLDYQNLRIVSLNSNERVEEQIPWMEKVLSGHNRTWTVVTFHHPIFSVAKERDNAALRNAWKPVFDRYGVDLVLTGHDHTYGRTGPAARAAGGSTAADGPSASSGTVYVVSVGGPKMYEVGLKARAELARVAEGLQLYQVISIEGPVLRYEARTATGEVCDAFTLRKRPGLPNEMTEQISNVPASRSSR